jgi:hypothetical protein
MSTSSNYISADDRRLTEIPQRIFEPAEITTPYEKALEQLGCWEKAQRSADCKRLWQFYKSTEDNSDAWRRPCFTLMVRTDPWKANKLAEEQRNTFHRFEELIGANFTMLQFRFRTQPFHLKSAEHEKQQNIVRRIRKVIDEFLPVSLDKLGTMEDKFNRYNCVLKAMYAGVVDSTLHKAIQAALPESVVLQHHVYSRAAFHEQFILLLSADLPYNDKARAAFEVFLTRLVQIQTHKIPGGRSRFAYNPNYTYANQPGNTNPVPLSDGLSEPAYCKECKKKHQNRIPRSPRTGAYAKYVSVLVDANTKVDDILPEEWMPLSPPMKT